MYVCGGRQSYENMKIHTVLPILTNFGKNIPIDYGSIIEYISLIPLSPQHVYLYGYFLSSMILPLTQMEKNNTHKKFVMCLYLAEETWVRI